VAWFGLVRGELVNIAFVKRVGVAVGIGAVAALGVTLPAAAATATCSAGTCTVTYSATNGDTFTIPAGVSSVNVAIKGAAGGNGGASGSTAPGGRGGAFHFTYPVTSGDQLAILIGGGAPAGTPSPGVNGVSAGGGADGVFLWKGSTLVAAAGGGGGAFGANSNGGDGGTFGANQNGKPGTVSAPGLATPAQGGTSTSGGSGGTGSGASGTAGTGPATPTTPGAGGAGGSGTNVGGGGGGGGYYGGGGGGAASGNFVASSGAGGSGYVISTATGAADDTPNTGPVSLVLTYADPGQVDAPAVNPMVGLAAGAVGAAALGGVVWARRRSAATAVK